MFLKTVDKLAKDGRAQSKNSLNPLAATEGSIKSQINRAIRDLKVEMPLSRKSLMQICEHMNLHVSYLQVTEAILYCRGKELENSTSFSFEKLLKWFQENIKTLRPLKQNLNQSFQYEQVHSRDSAKLILSSSPNKSMAIENISRNFNTNQKPYQSHNFTRTGQQSPNDLPTLKPQLQQLTNQRRFLQSSSTSNNPMMMFTQTSSFQQRKNYLSTSHQQNRDISQPDYNSSNFSARTKKDLQYDENFKQEMRACIDNLKKMPKLKNRVWKRIELMNQSLHEIQGKEGINAGIQARDRLRERKKKEEEKEQKNLDKLIEQTAQCSALQAINLSNLLRKKWQEEDNSYLILSKINDQKKMLKVNDYCFNRYIP